VGDISSAAFRSRPYTVTVSGLDLKFPCRTAADWLRLLSQPGSMLAVAQSMDEQSYESFLDAVQSGEAPPEDVIRIARAAESAAAGRPWWEVERLVGSLYADGGRLLGELTLCGVDPDRVSLAVYCSAIWARLVQDADATGRMKLESELSIPPADATADELEEQNEDVGQIVQRLRRLPGVSIG
jgi:hypothetical protein